jgi:hypothetical protein
MRKILFLVLCFPLFLVFACTCFDGCAGVLNIGKDACAYASDIQKYSAILCTLIGSNALEKSTPEIEAGRAGLIRAYTDSLNTAIRGFNASVK